MDFSYSHPFIHMQSEQTDHQHFLMHRLKQVLPSQPKKPQLNTPIVHRVSTELAEGT